MGEACGEVYWGVGVSSSSEEVWTLAGLGLLLIQVILALLRLACVLELWRGGIGGVGTLARSAS